MGLSESPLAAAFSFAQETMPFEASTCVTEAPAETPAPTPEPTEPPVETPAPQPIDYYRDILSRYAAATAAKTGPEELSSGGLNPFMAYSYGENGQEHIGYLLRDIDQDGTEELLIGFLTGDMYTDQIVLELYALENGNVTKVFSSGERDRYYLCSDSMIANEASLYVVPLYTRRICKS